MAKKNNFRPLFVAATSFVGGVALGLLLAPGSGSRNRAWLTDQATELSDWIDRQRKFASHRTNREFRKLRKNMGRGLKKNFPDLYNATEHIDLSDRDILGA